MKRILSVLILMSMALPAWTAEFRYQLRVDGLACPYCAYGMEKKIKALKGVNQESVEIRLNDGLVLFEANTDRPLEEARLKRLVNDAGFTLRGLETQSSEKESARDES